MKTLTNYQSACEELAIAFYHKFYTKEEAKGECFEWLDDIGGHMFLGDQLYSCYEMMEAIKLDVTREQLFEWYYGNTMRGCEACCEAGCEEVCGASRISLASFINGGEAYGKRRT